MQQLETISRYKIEKILGKGAVGTVYKAYDPVINQFVAIKVIHKHLLEQDDSGEQLKRFRNEVLAGRRLKHPNIVSIYEYGEEGDNAFIIMEFVEGRQLKDFLDNNHNFDPETTFKIMQQLLAALSYAHQQGVVHRDIKPANILVMQNWQIQVADFGIAQIENSSLTKTGMILGTPNYMSPEQCLGEHVDHRTDIFSAGVVLYYLLTGKRPFESETMMGTLQQVLKVTPINPSVLNKKISHEIDVVIGRALAKNPDDRFQSASEFSEELSRSMIILLKMQIDLNADDSTVIVPREIEPAPIARNGKEPTAMASGKIIKEEIRLIRTKKKKSVIFQIMIIGCGFLAVIGSALFLFFTKDTDNKIDSLLTKYQCAVLNKTISKNGKISLRGHLRQTDLESFKNEAAHLTEQVKIDYQEVKVWNNAFCEVIAILSPLKAMNDLKKLGLAIDSAKLNNRYIFDEYLEMNITMPNYPGYLYVDYFQLNGHVLHMYPSTDDQAGIKEANVILSIGQSGQDKRWQVSPPYGVELVAVIASPIPLFNQLRNEDELTEVYLSDLNALISNQEPGVTANYLTIETSVQ